MSHIVTDGNELPTIITVFTRVVRVRTHGLSKSGSARGNRLSSSWPCEPWSNLLHFETMYDFGNRKFKNEEMNEAENISAQIGRLRSGACILTTETIGDIRSADTMGVICTCARTHSAFISQPFVRFRPRSQGMACMQAKPLSRWLQHTAYKYTTS